MLEIEGTAIAALCAILLGLVILVIGLILEGSLLWPVALVVLGLFLFVGYIFTTLGGKVDD